MTTPIRDRAYVYVAIDGKAFDPVAFQASLPAELAGRVGKYRTNRRGCETYWNSTEQIAAVDAHPEVTLLELLRTLRPYLPTARAGIEIMPRIVKNLDSADGVHGLYVSRELISLLWEIGADLDYDLNCYV